METAMKKKKIYNSLLYSGVYYESAVIFRFDLTDN